MDIVRRIIKDHPRGKDVRIIEHPHNIGLGATRNTAIDNAQGEYLFSWIAMMRLRRIVYKFCMIR